MFEIQEGSQELKSLLEILLHEKGSKETGLGDFLEDLEETETTPHSWWCLVDKLNEPYGALTVRYSNNRSFLRSIWTRGLQYKDVQQASIKLMKTWVKKAKKGTNRFVADLPYQSPLVESLISAGFSKEKVLLTSYKVATDWYTEDLPANFLMRPIDRSEFVKTYQQLVKPDLDPASPIYVDEDSFLAFTRNLPDSALKPWVVVEDEKGELVGFGASFLSLEGEQTRAILYGPHSVDPLVLRAIIGEMLTYWKSKNIEALRILRVSEYHPNIVSHFNMELSHETIRLVSHLK